MDLKTVQKRITYQGDLNKLFKLLAEDYSLGKYQSFVPVLHGYEDFNIILQTSKGKFFVKLFANFRNSKDCRRYVNVIQTVIDSGINHPKLLQSTKGYFYETTIDYQDIRLCVTEFIGGETFFRLHKKPQENEIRFLIKQAASINLIDHKPEFVRDSWAISNLLEEYGKVKDVLPKDDSLLVEPVIKKYQNTDFDSLPHCFVHGDIIATNVMRAEDGSIYIIDFGVSNWYPRIQELAVILSDLLFIDNERIFTRNYVLALEEYQKLIKLEQKELDILPTYIQFVQAMFVVAGTRERKFDKNVPEENNYLLKNGQDGLKFSHQFQSN